MEKDYEVKFAFEDKCPYCGSSNISFTGMSHSRLVNSFEGIKVQKHTCQCNECEAFFKRNKKD